MNWALLGNSLVTSLCAVGLAGLIGFLVAVFVMGLGRPWRVVAFTVAALAFAMPPFFVTNAWLSLLGPDGVLQRFLPFQVASRAGVSFLLASMLWPVPMFGLIGAWERLGTQHLESDPLLRGMTLFRWLLVPSAFSALGLGLGLTFVLALNNFAVPAVLQVKVLPVEVYVRANANLDYWGALAMSWPLVLGPLVILACLQRVDVNWPRLSPEICPIAWRRAVRTRWFVAGGVVSLVMLIVSVTVPIAEPVRSVATWRAMDSVLVVSRDLCVRSIYVAAVSGLVITTLGFLLARVRIGFLSWVLFLVPGVVFGILLIKALNRPPFFGVYRSVGIMVIALLLRYLAIGRTGGLIVSGSVDCRLVDVARLDGASWWQTFVHVCWPQMRVPLAITWYLAYLLCLWDAETIILVVPPGRETLVLRIFNLLHYGHNPEINALCLILLAVAVLPLLLWFGVRQIRLAVGSGNVRFELPRLGTAVGSVWRRGALFVTACGVIVVLAGCSQSEPARVTFRSKLFDRVEIIGTRGTAPGQFNKPRSLTVDRQNNLYVVDMTGRVQKFAPDGTWLLSWQMPQTDLGKPKGMGIDKDGLVIVIEPHYARINHFTPDGVLVRQWGTHGTNAGQIAFPRAVAVNGRGEIFVSEYGRVDRVQRFTADGGNLLGVIGCYGYGPGQFNRPEGLCVDKDERVYVADSCNHRIQVFEPDGKLLRSYGRPGDKDGQMSYPYDICVDTAGFQFVCEFGNSRIQVFDSRDQHVETIGEPGRHPGQFANPWSVALDSRGNLYVADAGNDRVQKLLRR